MHAYSTGLAQFMNPAIQASVLLLLCPSGQSCVHAYAHHLQAGSAWGSMGTARILASALAIAKLPLDISMSTSPSYLLAAISKSLPHHEQASLSAWQVPFASRIDCLQFCTMTQVVIGICALDRAAADSAWSMQRQLHKQ